MNRVRVMLADDHPVARAGIRNFLEKAPDIDVVGEATNGEEAIPMVQELKPDVLLLDMEMPGLKGIDVARQLHEMHNEVKILALSSYDDKQFIYGLLTSGAAGYLTKEEVPETIVDAVRGVANGERGWMSRRVSAKMAAWSYEEETPKVRLTGREMEVLRLVVAAKTNQEIGLTLGISEKTVEKHLEAVFSKMRVSSRVEAAVRAVQEGMV